MKYFFCFLTHEEGKDGTNLGRTFAYANKARWKEATNINEFLTVGFNKGTDFVVHENKAYVLLKSFLDIKDKQVVFIAVEDISGCNV